MRLGADVSVHSIAPATGRSERQAWMRGDGSTKMLGLRGSALVPWPALAFLALTACAGEPDRSGTASPSSAVGSAAARSALAIPGANFVPLCKLEGCCAGHGAIAYVQPDKFIMCTDGEPSQICDCH
jgi:hypothetical protein